MKNFIFMCLLLLCHRILASDIEVEGDVLVLTNENFDKALAENDHILVDFYAPWCGACKTIAPEFAQAAKLLKEEGLNVKLARVDAIKETDVMAENEVKMYPTLKWFVKGEAFKYKGNKFGQGIATWVKKALNNEFELVKDTSKTFQQMKREADLKKAQEEAELAKAEVKDKKTQEKKAEEEKPEVKITDEKKPEKKDKKDKKAKKEPKEPKEEIPDEVMNLTDENIDAALNDNKYLLVQFYAPWCGHCKRMGPDYKKAAQQLKVEGHEVKIARLDATKEMISKKKYKAGGYPTLRFFVNGEPYKYGGSRQEDGIIAWVKAAAAGRIQLESIYNDTAEKDKAKSDAIEDLKFKNEPDEVLVLTDENFEETLENNKYLLVKFYAPWCGHCRKMAPAYRKAAQILKNEGHAVKLAKIDAVEEKISKKTYRAKSYPTLRFFVNGEPYKYDGNRGDDDIIEWVKKAVAGEMELEPLFEDEPKEEKREPNEDKKEPKEDEEKPKKNKKAKKPAKEEL